LEHAVGNGYKHGSGYGFEHDGARDRKFGSRASDGSTSAFQSDGRSDGGIAGVFKEKQQLHDTRWGQEMLHLSRAGAYCFLLSKCKKVNFQRK
jgi:hypothetical protein